MRSSLVVVVVVVIIIIVFFDLEHLAGRRDLDFVGVSVGGSLELVDDRAVLGLSLGSREDESRDYAIARNRPARDEPSWRPFFLRLVQSSRR